MACGTGQQWLRAYAPPAKVLKLSASYANFSSSRIHPPPQQAPTTPAHSREALEYAVHRGLRTMPGHLIPNNDYDRFFDIVQRIATQQKKAAEHSVMLSLKIAQHVFAHEAESEDMTFAAEALRRMQGLCEIDGNVFLGEKDGCLPPIHHHSAIHVIRKINPKMHSFGANHGDSPDALVCPDSLTRHERNLFDRGDLMLNARLIGGQHQSTFVECPLGGWRLYQRPMIPGGYVAMDGECRFQGPLFLHGSVHHSWREENDLLPERPQHMLAKILISQPYGEYR